MPFMIPLLPALFGAGAGIAGSAISGGSKTATQTSTPQLPPELQGLQGDLISRLTARLQNPGAGLDTMKIGAIQGINDQYKDAPQKIMERLASRGLNDSGVAGKAQYQTEIARNQDIAGLEPKFAALASDREQQSIQDSMNLIAARSGTQTTATSPNNALGAGLTAGSSALENWMAYERLNSIITNLGGNQTGSVNIGGSGGYLTTRP